MVSAQLYSLAHSNFLTSMLPPSGESPPFLPAADRAAQRPTLQLSRTTSAPLPDWPAITRIMMQAGGFKGYKHASHTGMFLTPWVKQKEKGDCSSAWNPQCSINFTKLLTKFFCRASRMCTMYRTLRLNCTQVNNTTLSQTSYLPLLGLMF